MATPETRLSQVEKFNKRYAPKASPEAQPKKEDIAFVPKDIPEELRLKPRFDEVAIPAEMLSTMPDEHLTALHLTGGKVACGVQVFIARERGYLKVRTYVFKPSENKLVGSSGTVAAASPSYAFLCDMLQARTDLIRTLRPQKKK